MTAHPDCDVVVVGAGHNALVCAAYLAKAGLRVTVLERRAVVGGAVVTEEIVPGYRFDLGGSAHILIHHTPIVADLELERYGLDYLDLDQVRHVCQRLYVTPHDLWTPQEATVIEGLWPANQWPCAQPIDMAAPISTTPDGFTPAPGTEPAATLDLEVAR